ncbi:MAG: hypothetical protein JXR03_09420 [Cyclobacteriaceae bacterium]
MRQLLHVLTFILSTLSAYSQGFNERHPNIQNFINEINAELATSEKVTVENEELMEQMTDGGGELTGYFANGQIQKMELSVGLSYGISELEFFYGDSKLYFVLETFRQFKYNEETGSFNYSTTEQTFKGEYLFVDPFDYETLGHNRFENDELDPEEVLGNEANTYLIILQKKNAR